MSRSLCIATHHPSVGGGVGAMMRAVAQHGRENAFQPSFLFPSKSVGDAVRGGAVTGLPCPGYHYRSIPYLHLLNFWLPALTARRDLRRFDIHHAVGGFSLPGLPLYLNRLDYVCWVATTLKEEWQARYRWNDFSYRNIPSHANVPFLPLIYHFEKQILERATHVFALSHYTARCMRDDMGLKNPSMEVVPFQVDTERFSPDIGPALPEFDYLFMCGRADDSRKNIPLLLDAFARLRDRFPSLRLLVAGPKPQRRQVWATLERLKLTDRVQFLGPVDRDQLPGYYRGAKIKVLSSAQEGLAIVVLEAMASGIPVVSTRCGGPEEILTDGREGYLVPNHDSDALAAALADLLSDEERRREMGRAARARVLDAYSLQEVGYPFADRYRERLRHS